MHFRSKVLSALLLSGLLSTGIAAKKADPAPTPPANPKTSTGNGLWNLHDMLWSSTTKGAMPVNELYKLPFYEIANQNSYYSTAYNGYCFGTNLCFSGIANVDAAYFTRGGALGTPPGSFTGFGNRPVFGPNSVEYFGSMNNADLFVDARINDWALMHFDIAYVNGSVKSRYANHEHADWGDVYRNGSSVKANEAYLFFGQPEVLPVYAKLGKLYLNFGDYKQFPMTESLTQLLSQMRTGAVIVGFVLPNGMYASANWSMSQQSIDNINNFSLFGSGGSKSKNWGGQAGIRNNFNGIDFNVNASYIKDIRDSDYLSGGAQLFNADLKLTPFGGFLLANQVIVMQRRPGVAIHGDAQYGRFGVLAEYVTATRTLNPTVPDGKIYAWTTAGNVKFKVLNFDSMFDVSYQRGGNSNVYQTIATGPTNFPLLSIGNVLPKHRIQFTYTVNVMPNVVVGVQWLRDKDKPSSQGGTNLTSDKGMIRVSAQI